MIRVAMISFWHVHAGDYARQARENPATEIVAAWDELPERGRTRSQELGAKFYENLPELLAQPDIDAVIIDTPTNIHHDVLIAAARAGKHIFTEKVLAPTLQECNQILSAIEQAGVKLTVSLPRLYERYTLTIKDILARKQLGDITLVRTRLSHNGALPTANNAQGWLPAHFFNLEQCGGGALIDLGCHPMYLARLFMGAELPLTVSAEFSYLTGKEVEDNAVAVLHHKNGALGVVEAGFVNSYSPFTIEVHGTAGSLYYGYPGTASDHIQIRSTAPEIGGEEWHAIPIAAQNYPRAFDQWVEHIQQGTTADENIAMAVDLSALMEAANLSARNKQPVRLDSLAR